MTRSCQWTAWCCTGSATTRPSPPSSASAPGPSSCSAPGGPDPGIAYLFFFVFFNSLSLFLLLSVVRFFNWFILSLSHIILSFSLSLLHYSLNLSLRTFSLSLSLTHLILSLSLSLSLSLPRYLPLSLSFLSLLNGLIIQLMNFAAFRLSTPKSRSCEDILDTTSEE